MNLKEEYEKYKKEKEMYERELHAYNKEMESLQNKLRSFIESVDLDRLEALGVKIEIDIERLADKEYCKSKMEELRMQRDKVEELGLSLLRGA